MIVQVVIGVHKANISFIIMKFRHQYDDVIEYLFLF
jgi:hypothetical protein